MTAATTEIPPASDTPTADLDAARRIILGVIADMRRLMARVWLLAARHPDIIPIVRDALADIFKGCGRPGPPLSRRGRVAAALRAQGGGPATVRVIAAATGLTPYAAWATLRSGGGLRGPFVQTKAGRPALWGLRPPCPAGA